MSAQINTQPMKTNTETKQDITHWPAKFEMINKEELRVDPSYQPRERVEEDQKAIKTIVENFDWEKFGVLIVGDRRGVRYVVDGQRRLESTRRIPEISEVPCIVFQSDSPKAEARAFVGINKTRKSVNPIHLFYADVVGADKLSCEIDSFLKQQGYRVGFITKNPLVIQCVNVLKTLWKTDANSVKAIWPTLKTMTRGDDAEQGIAISAQLLKTFFYLQTSGKMNDELAEYWKIKGAGAAEVAISGLIAESKGGQSKRKLPPNGPELWALSLIQPWKAHKKANAK